MIVAAPEGLIGLLGGASRPDAMPPPTKSARRTPTPTGAAPLLELRGVSKRFGGVRALRDVSLAVALGEIVGLIGPNGSGKTTLLNVVSGLYPADAGAVICAGRDIGGLRPFEIARSGLARSFQLASLVDDMPAIDNVAVAFTGRAVSLVDARARALALLAELGIERHASDRAAALPQGVRRRLEIARALALEPQLVLLDEPAAGLTQGEMADLSTRLRVLAREGIAFLIVEHNMPFLLPLADRVVCLAGGAVVGSGSPENIRKDPAVLGAYLGTGQ
jgi:branched-chain amino acid transport system permease protein